jgi:hypothetical protein
VVQWVDAGTMARIESVSLQELFARVALKDKESRFLMISRLGDDGTERQGQVRRELGALYPAGAGEGGDGHVASALGGVDLKGKKQKCRMQTLLGELAELEKAGAACDGWCIKERGGRG